MLKVHLSSFWLLIVKCRKTNDLKKELFSKKEAQHKDLENSQPTYVAKNESTKDVVGDHLIKGLVWISRLHRSQALFFRTLEEGPQRPLKSSELPCPSQAHSAWSPGAWRPPLSFKGCGSLEGYGTQQWTFQRVGHRQKALAEPSHYNRIVQRVGHQGKEECALALRLGIILSW